MIQRPSASKENCQKALEELALNHNTMYEESYDVLKNFLESCLKKLPTEASIKKDKERKSVKK